MKHPLCDGSFDEGGKPRPQKTYAKVVVVEVFDNRVRVLVDKANPLIRIR